MHSTAITGTSFDVEFVLRQLKGKVPDDCSVSDLVDFSVNDITGGSAFMSQILRLEFQWKTEDKNRLKSVILKVPGVQNAKRFRSNSLGSSGEETEHIDMDTSAEMYLEFAHTREILFYKVFPHYDASLKLPAVYYGYDFSRSHQKGLIIMEDLSPFAKTTRLLPGLSNEQMEAAIDELAKVHAVSWQNREWMKKLPQMQTDPQLIKEMVMMANILKQIKPEWFTELVDRAVKLYSMEMVDKCIYTEEKYGFPPSIVHSDLWSANLLWHIDENGEPGTELAAIIDWQSAHAGNPCEDLARLLSLNTSGTYRRSNTDRLLQRYADKVAEKLGGKAPFTMEQLKEAYNAALGYVMMFLGFGAPMYYNMPAVVDGPNSDELKLELLTRVKMYFEDACSVYGV